MADVGTIRAILVADSAAFVSGIQKAGAQLREFSAGVSSMAGQVAAAAGALAIPLNLIGARSIAAAVSVETTLNRIGVAFGDLAPAAVKTSDAIASGMGKSKNEVREVVVGVQSMLRPLLGSRIEAAALSEQMSRAALSVAELTGGSNEEALNAFRAGLQGNGRALQQFNVFLGEGESNVKAWAASQGKAFDSMSEHDKVLTRAKFILQETAAAQEAVANSSGGMKDTMDQLNASVDDLFAGIGSALTPAIGNVAREIENAVGWLSSLDKSTTQTLLKIGLFITGLAAVSGVVAVFAPLVGLLATIGGIAAGVLGPILLIGAGIGTAVLAVGTLRRVWTDDFLSMRTIVTSMAGHVSSTFRFLGSAVTGTVDLLARAATGSFLGTATAADESAKVARIAFNLFFDAAQVGFLRINRLAANAVEALGKPELANQMRQAAIDVALGSEEFRKAQDAKLKVVEDALGKMRGVAEAAHEAIDFDFLWAGLKEAVSLTVDSAKAVGVDFAAEIKKDWQSGLATVKDAIKGAIGQDAFNSLLEGASSIEDFFAKLKAKFDDLTRTGGVVGVKSSVDPAAIKAGADPAPRVARVVDGFVKNLGNALAESVTGIAGQLVKAAVRGDAIGAILAVVTASSGFQKVMTALEGLFQELAEVLTPLFEILLPVISIISGALSPILRVFAGVFKDLAPIFSLLQTIVTILNPIILALVAPLVLTAAGLSKLKVPIEALGNAVGALIDWLFDWIADWVEIFDEDAAAEVREFGKSLHGMTDANGEIVAALKTMKDLNWARLGELKAVVGMTKAAQEAAESLTNVPVGFKVAAARFRAIRNDATAAAAAAPGAGGPGGPSLFGRDAEAEAKAREATGRGSGDVGGGGARSQVTETEAERAARTASPGTDNRTEEERKADAEALLAAIPHFARGAPPLPQDTVALLHKGEEVVRPGGRSGGTTIVANFYGVTDADGLWRRLKALAQRDAVRDGGGIIPGAPEFVGG